MNILLISRSKVDSRNNNDYQLNDIVAISEPDNTYTIVKNIYGDICTCLPKGLFFAIVNSFIEE